MPKSNLRPGISIALTEGMLERTNIGRRYWPATFSGISPSEHKQVIQKYVDNFDKNYADGWGLFLFGDNSRGKTFAASAVVKYIISRGLSAFCVPADNLRAVYIDRAMFEDGQTILERVNNVDVLMIDDLGKEYNGSGSGWAELCFENLLRGRNRELKPTLVTTNLSLPAFRERYKKSATALAIESMVTVEVAGEDIRKRLLRDKLKEFSGE